MPAKAAWLLQIPEILAHLEVFDVPVVDRAIIEHLFGLRRRRAIELMHLFGGYQAGRTCLIDRRRLIDYLRSMAEGEDFQRERRRKERLHDKLDQFRRSEAAMRVKIPVQPDVRSRKMADLSAGVALEAGHLHIEFSGTEDLLTKLFELSQAAANDFDRFRAASEPATQRSA
jgi:hypothetical protein